MSVDHKDSGGQRPAQHVRPLHVVIAAVVIFALWFTFVGTRAAHEMEVGAAASLLSLTFCAFAQGRSRSRISLHLKDILQAWRIPWYILSDAATIILVLLKDLLHIAPAEDLYRVSSFAPVGEESGHIGRRVLATSYTTATPSIIVIGIDVEQRRMLFHQIKRDDLPFMTKALGAHP